MPIQSNDVAHLTLSNPIVNIVLDQVRKKQKTVGNGGAHWTAPSTEHKSKIERQVTGYLAEMGFHVYWYGAFQGPKRFYRYREEYNKNPTRHDGGDDFMGMDIKGRRIIRSGPNANWYKYPIKQNIMNFELIIRPQHAYSPDHMYALILVEYDDCLLHGRPKRSTVRIMGYGSLSDAKHYPNGQFGIRGNHYVLNKTSLTPITNLFDMETAV